MNFRQVRIQGGFNEENTNGERNTNEDDQGNEGGCEMRMRCVLTAVLALADVWTAIGGVTIFDDGAYRVDIVLPMRACAVEQLAVEELKHHLDKAFGASVDVVTEDRLDVSDKPHHIFVGATKGAVTAGLVPMSLADEEHVVRTFSKGICLLGKDDALPREETLNLRTVMSRGTLYAAYDFLENELGVRWVWPGKTGEVIPRRHALTVGDIDRKSIEPLAYRIWNTCRVDGSIGFARPETAAVFQREESRFLLRHRHGRRSDFSSEHSFGKYWKRFSKTHPEFFARLPNGKRQPPGKHGARVSMCVSEPGLWRQVVADWQERLAASPKGLPWVNCCENDFPGVCTCENCRKWDGPDPRFAISSYWNGSLTGEALESAMADFSKAFGDQFSQNRWLVHDPKARVVASVSDRYARFYNAVLAEARKVRPDARVVGYSYVNYVEAPLEAKVDPGVIIEYVPRTYFPYDREESEFFRRQWSGWRCAGVRDFIYRPNYTLLGNYPIDNSRVIAADFAFAATNGMFACFFDSLRGAWSAQALMNYAIARAFRDPTHPYDDTRREMLSAFGTAARGVDAYFGLVERNTRRWTADSYYRISCANTETKSGWPAGSCVSCAAVLGEFFEDSFFTEAYACLDAAARATDDEAIRARVDFLRKGVRDTELTRACRLAQKRWTANKADESLGRSFRAAFGAMSDYRASVEADLVCNYQLQAKQERSRLKWPHRPLPQRQNPSVKPEDVQW